MILPGQQTVALMARSTPKTTKPKATLARLLAGCSCAVFLAAVTTGELSAQQADPKDQRSKKISNALETLGIPKNEAIDFEADQLTFDAENDIVKAIGRVRLIRDSYMLKAGTVTYNRKTGVVEATGAVELTTPSGEKLVAPQMIVNDGLSNAFIDNFRLLFSNGAQAAATSGSYDEATGLTELNSAVFSPCDICEGQEEPPQWQIKAVKITHDRNKRRLYYKNASLEIFGLPVIWTPFFSHPDQTSERASGFLAPKISQRRELGLRIGLPYHISFSESEDLTLTPIITTRESAVLAAEYRKHHGWLNYTAEGSITRTDVRDNLGQTTGEREFRGHLSFTGQAFLGDGWRSSFDLNYASDDTYLRRYDFSNTDVLVSDVNLERFFDNAYLSARTLAFQGLRIEDDAGLTAFALPLLTAEYTAPFKPLGGTVEVDGSFLNLVRFEGLDTLRASAALRWRKRTILPKGLVLDVDSLVRGDVYNISDVNRPDDPAFTGIEEEASRQNGSSDAISIARGVTRLTSTLSWPLVKPVSGGAHTLEPLFQVTLQPNTGQPDNLVIEDARSFELTDLNILSSERAAGLDLVEEGTRITYGLKWRYEGQDLSTDVFLGQSVRLSGSVQQFADGVGLTGTVSDWVGNTTVRYGDLFTFQHRYRLDESSLAFRRNEIITRFGDQESFIQLGYFNLDRDLNFINREDREELRANAGIAITDKWQLTGGVIQDLTNGFDGIEFSTGLGYVDECIAISFQVRRTFFEDRDVQPGTQFQFRLSLRNIG